MAYAQQLDTVAVRLDGGAGGSGGGTIGPGTSTTFTDGSVIFAQGGVLAQDNANFSFNNTTHIFTAAGGILGKVVPSAKTASYPVVAGDSGKLFTNTGSSGTITFSLPAVASGLAYSFYVADNHTVVIDAAGTDLIRIDGSVSSAGGTLTSNAQGDFIQVYSNGVVWFAGGGQGSWTAA